MRTLSPAGYIWRLAATIIVVLALVWVYVVAAPLAFLPSGYPAWVAKQTMLRECRLGFGFFGDSRLEAGLIPAAMPVASSNLGFAGGTPIEVETAVRRALRCDRKPDLVVISVGPTGFGPLTESFWQESLRYGFVTPHALWRLERRASTLDDWNTLNQAVTPDGLSGPIRDWLYALRFPSLFFGNLLNAQLFRRHDENLTRLHDVLEARGFIPYHTVASNDVARPEAKLTGFVRTPLKTDYFEATLRLLNANGLPVDLLVMPIKAITYDAMPQAVEAGYIGYLRSLTNRFPNVRLINDHIPKWPDAEFADDLHLAPVGARHFSDRLAACVEASAIRSNCDLDWDGSAADTDAPAPPQTSPR